jgi:PAS domain S-box-containing protein
VEPFLESPAEEVARLQSRLAQLTTELAAANEALRSEAAERKRAEEELRNSERDWRLIVDNIPGLVALLSPTGDVDVVNRQLLEYFGQTLEELRQWGTNGTVHPEDLPHVVDVFTRSIASGSPYDIVQRFRRSDRAYRWFENRGFPLRDAEGRIVRWCVLLTDIDERRQAEDALMRSERDLKLIIDTVPALAWSARPDGKADFFNRHYLEFIGFSAEQAGDWGWTAAVHPEDLSGLSATWQRIMDSEAPGEAEARLRGPDGEFRWFLFRANPLRDETGRIIKWYGVNTDIEDRKKAEAELRRAYDSFADGQRLSHTGNFTADIVADEHTWSEELYRIFEFDPAIKITVQAVRDVIHPDDLPSFDAGFTHSLGGAEFDLVFRIVTAGGRVKHVRSVAHLVERIAGRPLFIGAIQDVTETKVAEQALDKARSELAHVARISALGALTASIAHEVNQPLSGIMTNASTCLRMLDADPPNVDGARETARRTIRDGNRASDVITRLRALFTKKESPLEAMDLNEATREVIALSLNDLRRSRVMFRSELAEDVPPVIGDRVQLQQVILNLVLNAAESLREVDDRARELTIRTERDGGDRVRVTVRDTGVGVDRESMDKLFDAFYTTKRGGMGIGLSVSRSIVERHHGRLWVEPNDGPGATFVFSIPCGGERVTARSATGPTAADASA